MKVVIFAGGIGSRLSEETHTKPKPMVEIGGMPILWHIMKTYSHYGYNEFVICLGYKGHVIKDWFTNYYLYNSDITIDLSNNTTEIHKKHKEDWKITLIETGDLTSTATRLKRVKKYVGDGDFMLTYGDGVSNVNIKELVDFHKKSGKIATVTAVQPDGRFGTIKMHEEGHVQTFAEKIDNKDTWINGGFFVLKPEVFDYIPDHDVMWEQDPLINLANDKKMTAYKHNGFWKAMDTLRDKNHLEKMWQDNPLWKIWE
jgi:glucose-1-phosphate cytidylyltransferase